MHTPTPDHHHWSATGPAAPSHAPRQSLVARPPTTSGSDGAMRCKGMGRQDPVDPHGEVVCGGPPVSPLPPGCLSNSARPGLFRQEWDGEKSLALAEGIPLPPAIVEIGHSPNRL